MSALSELAEDADLTASMTLAEGDRAIAPDAGMEQGIDAQRPPRRGVCHTSLPSLRGRQPQ